MKLIGLILALFISTISSANDHCALITDYSINLRSDRDIRGIVHLYTDNYGESTRIGAVYWTKDYEETTAALFFQLLKNSGPVFRSTNRYEHTIITSLIPVGKTKPELGVPPQCYPTSTNISRREYYSQVQVTHYQIKFSLNAEIGPDNIYPNNLFAWPEGPLDYSLEIYFYNRFKYAASAKLKFNEIYSALPAYMELLTGDDKLYTSFGSLYTRQLR